MYIYTCMYTYVNMEEIYISISIYLYIYLSIDLSICLSIYLSIHLSIYIDRFVYIYMDICTFNSSSCMVLESLELEPVHVKKNWSPGRMAESPQSAKYAEPNAKPNAFDHTQCKCA